MAKRDRVLAECTGDEGWTLDRTPVIDDAIGMQRLSRYGLGWGERTRSTKVVSFRFWER
ncbi:hypothetical protein MLD52_08735 [Puniceicoccaceae bacterium K14]|nr:hypothetical protein [Puniceicoccaceae bacterium K14]